MGYSWPGNIRELQHTIEKTVILSETAVIKPEDLYLRSVAELKNLDSIATIEEMEEKDDASGS